MKHNSDDLSFSQKWKIQKILKDIQNYVDIENSFENRL